MPTPAVWGDLLPGSLVCDRFRVPCSPAIPIPTASFKCLQIWMQCSELSSPLASLGLCKENFLNVLSPMPRWRALSLHQTNGSHGTKRFLNRFLTGRREGPCHVALQIAEDLGGRERDTHGPFGLKLQLLR